MQKRLTTTLILHPAVFPHRCNIVQTDVWKEVLEISWASHLWWHALPYHTAWGILHISTQPFACIWITLKDRKYRKNGRKWMSWSLWSKKEKWKMFSNYKSLKTIDFMFSIWPILKSNVPVSVEDSFEVKITNMEPCGLFVARHNLWSH